MAFISKAGSTSQLSLLSLAPTSRAGTRHCSLLGPAAVEQLTGTHSQLSPAARMPHLLISLWSCWCHVADVGTPRSWVCCWAHFFLPSVPFWKESNADRRVFLPRNHHVVSLTITYCITTAKQYGIPYSQMKCGDFLPCLIVLQCVFCA